FDQARLIRARRFEPDAVAPATVMRVCAGKHCKDLIADPKRRLTPGFHLVGLGQRETELSQSYKWARRHGWGATRKGPDVHQDTATRTAMHDCVVRRGAEVLSGPSRGPRAGLRARWLRRRALSLAGWACNRGRPARAPGGSAGSPARPIRGDIGTRRHE